jgi:ABC-2 type transport system ATP-binding protein
MAAAIETEALTKSYGAQRGVVALDLEVLPGEVFGFLGPNGAGKTTTIRLLMDFLRPTAGAARVLGLDSRRYSVEIHRRVGYVAGEHACYERLTAGQQLSWFASVRGAVPRRTIDDLADRLDLDLGRPIGSLSRGNRQKVALVQAFLHQPELLLLDEPTSGLDPLVQETFHQLVAEAVARGSTVFLSSHVLDEVDHLCDRVGIVRDGRLVAVERVEDLRGRAGRVVTVRFAGDVDPAPFTTLAGVSDVVVQGHTVRLRASGDLDPLVKLAATHHVVDLIASPPELEEIFLGYYRHDHDHDHEQEREHDVDG